VNWPISVSEWTLRDDNVERCIERIARLGYDGIELAGRPERSTSALSAALAAAQLQVYSVCTVFSEDRDYAHPDTARRNAARDYLRAVLDQAGELGASVVIVVPTYRPRPVASRRDELAYAAETIRLAAEDAPESGPALGLEPLNQYETHLIRTLDDAEELRTIIGLRTVKLMADTFHMNIEEREPAAALAAYGASLAHVHLADSSRREPGTGHVDFAAVAHALRDAGYQGTLAMEFLSWSDDAGAEGLAHVRAAFAERDQLRQSTVADTGE
jgi:D-psicose/D-tagatose/L-ribulose 3-epimerase